MKVTTKEEERLLGLQLRSEEVQEIMTRIPSWMVRWGITVFFSILLVILVGSYLFKYPVVVQAEITITTAEPAANIIARSSGRLEQILVINGQRVKKGEPLAIIQNSAFTKDMLELLRLMSKIETERFTPEQIYQLVKRKSFNLGGLQPVYNQFFNTTTDLVNYIKLDYYRQKMFKQKRQIVLQTDYYEKLKEQSLVVSKSRDLSQGLFKRDSILHLRDVISDKDFDISRQGDLDSRRSYLTFEATLNQEELQLAKSRENLFDLERESYMQLSHYQLSFQTSLKEVMAEIRNWEYNYLLTSPINGKINLLSIWSKNQNVINGETVFSISPDDAKSARGTALLPIKRSGYVKVGQLVNIQVNNFPDKEFGYLKGRVKSISNTVISNGFYVLEIELLNGLKTNYGIELPRDQEQVGIANIITKDERLLERVFLPLKQIINLQKEQH